jgi:hypothetical protein
MKIYTYKVPSEEHSNALTALSKYKYIIQVTSIQYVIMDLLQK